MTAARAMTVALSLMLVVVAFASSTFAFSGMRMPAPQVAHEVAMEMVDCPGHSAEHQGMDVTACQVACYGLAVTVVGDAAVAPLPAAEIAQEFADARHQLLVEHTVGVPTPPPNFV